MTPKPPRCESCKHWRNPWDPYPLDAGKVDEAQYQRWGTCSKIDMPSFAPVDDDVLAFTQDGSDYRADLHTRSDFGCVLWADK